jgi:pimeloyl-ACP methyl ester carboxylesterase
MAAELQHRGRAQLDAERVFDRHAMHVVALAERTVFIEDPAMWHFGFGGQDMERLVAGRERIYLDRFWNERSRDPRRFDEAKRQHYAALYAQPGAMRAGFAQFLAFSQDAIDNRTFLAQGKLQMPVLALGGEATFGPMIGRVLRCAADNVQDVIIPDCGHWITEEQPAATTKLVVDFLRRRS